MRKIEKDMLAAIRNRKTWKCKNTEVKVSPMRTIVCLHRNVICVIDHATGDVTYDNCGYHTSTTRSRLNAIASEITPRQTGFRIRDYTMQVLSDGVWCDMYSTETVNPFEV